MLKNRYKYHNLRGEILRCGFEKEDNFAAVINMQPRTFKSKLMGKTPFTINEIKLISYKLKEFSGSDERLEFKYLFKEEGDLD
jgi:hypothetical protein